ncbi:MAG TPA: DUF2232 domain-containing protein [Bryobacterales bacterium]|nr:DUF2232 domain-containing protein [Bryobacterales bacterium]
MSGRSWIVMAVAAGALSGVAFLGIIAPSLVSILMFYMSPLPLFMVGLAFGLPAVALAALSGLVFISFVLSLKAAAFYVVSMAIAPVVLVHLALKWRPAAGGAEGEAADDSGREWYPEGRLLLWTAFMGGALVSVLLLMTGPDLETIRATLSQMAGQMLKMSGAADELPADQVERLKEFVSVATPLVSTAFWVVAMLFNLWLAARLLRAFGYETRPWAPFWKLTFHPRAMAALAVAAFATFLPGVLGLIGSVFAMALLAAFAILGFAVIHGLTLGNPWRNAILAVLYGGLIVMGWLILLPLVALALADLTFDLRGKYFRKHPPPRD